jgi:hypothetical protein
MRKLKGAWLAHRRSKRIFPLINNKKTGHNVKNTSYFLLH